MTRLGSCIIRSQSVALAMIHDQRVIADVTAADLRLAAPLWWSSSVARLDRRRDSADRGIVVKSGVFSNLRSSTVETLTAKIRTDQVRKSSELHGSV